MYIFFIVLIFLHGLIHTMGYLKAYGYAELKELKKPIGKSDGLVWAISTVLFVLTGLLNLIGFGYWWIFGIIATFTSQFIILKYWSDAKIGTIANIIIFIGSIMGVAEFNFQNTILLEKIDMLGTARYSEKTISQDDLESLPYPVAKWLESSGTLNHKYINTVYLQQNAQMKLDDEATDWTDATAYQYFTIDEPSFLWVMDTDVYGIVDVSGKDRFVSGVGEMQINVASLIPVVDMKDTPKINESTMQRYLGEIVWFPTAALSKYIKWEMIDSTSARATMEYAGTKAEGIFRFGKDGLVKEYEAMRYYENEPEKYPWIISVLENKKMDDILIPTKAEATWVLPDKEWTWLKLEINKIEYNVKANSKVYP